MAAKSDEREHRAGQRRRRVSRRFVLGILCATLCAAAAMAAVFAYAYALLASPRIARGVSISGVDVGGLTREEARDALRRELEPLLDKEVWLTYGEDAWRHTLRKLGVALDIESSVARAYRVAREGGALAGLLTRRRVAREGRDITVALTIDRRKLAAAIRDLAREVERPAKDASVRFDWQTHAIYIVREQTERRLDVPGTLRKVMNTLRTIDQRRIPIVLREKPPRLRAAELKGINCELAAFRTRYSEWEVDRAHNLKLAAQALDGALLMPGEVLSYNERVGQRKPERGYRIAPIFRNGEVEPGLGGGVCQLSTTLYNAALLANLTVVERHNHIMPVHYVPLGRDATVSYEEGIDLKIKNTLSHPIWIAARAKDGYVSVVILGNRRDKAEVELLCTDITTTPFEEETKLDPEAEPGSREVEQEGRNGYSVTLWRIVRKGGREVKRERLHRDYYPMRKQIVVEGPPAQPTPESGAPWPGAQTPTPQPSPTPARSST